MTVEIRDGGIGYMRVTDNGCGIEPGQVRLAFENHATSKLVTPEQLDDIRTLGFRGEALPSIAAVARVEMTTRAKAQEAGTRLNVEGGRNMIVREIGCPEGTTVIMRDLFFNIPVRRAFLRKAQYEAALVNDTVARMILGSPKISFRFINNGRTVYHSFGDGDLRHAVFAVYGRETAENMLEVDQSEGAMRICGLVGVGNRPRRRAPRGVLHQWPLGALSAALAGFGERLPRTRHHRHVSHVRAAPDRWRPEVWTSTSIPTSSRCASATRPRRASPWKACSATRCRAARCCASRRKSLPPSRRSTPSNSCRCPAWTVWSQIRPKSRMRKPKS